MGNLTTAVASAFSSPLSLMHLFPNVADVACSVAAMYGGTRGFTKWCNTGTMRYKLPDDDNIFTEIVNGCIALAVFTAYTVGTAAASSFFLDNILMLGPLYGMYRYSRNTNTRAGRNRE
jgi:hypothetical protein